MMLEITVLGQSSFKFLGFLCEITGDNDELNSSFNEFERFKLEATDIFFIPDFLSFIVCCKLLYRSFLNYVSILGSLENQ